MNTAWRDFRFHLVSILMLAFGLVGFTVVGLGAISNWLLPGFDWRIGLVLGSVLCTTDAIAATSIASRVGLPRRIIDVLEGESLVNDASGLLALEFAVALVTTGERPTLTAGILQILYLLGGGILVGLVVAWIAQFAQKHVSDAPVEITISLVVPYLAYLSAEELHASGALAVVVCGLYMGRVNSEVYTTQARLEGIGVWNTLDFILNGTVFIVIGLQLRSILADIRNMSPSAADPRCCYCQRRDDRPASALDVSGRGMLLCHPPVHPEAEHQPAFTESGLHYRLDWYARRTGPGGRYLSAADTR